MSGQDRIPASRDDWPTPQWLADQLAAEFGAFDLDPAASPDNAKAPVFFTEADDGLSQPWKGRVWLNPPYGPVELAGGTWRKKLLPIGEIQYQGRTLKFTRNYLAGLVRAWQDGAYDQVPPQFADASNAHTNDPERTRGRITSMALGDDGLYVTAELTDRGQRTLAENPYLGVSARIVEQYQRADGKFYPAAIQHVLAMLDPRIPGLGAWEPVQLSNESNVVIDLSSLSFGGQPAPLTASDLDNLTDAELNDLIDVLGEEYDADYGDGDGELTDDELEALMREVDAHYDSDSPEDAFSEFSATFNDHAAIELARAAAAAEPPARRKRTGWRSSSGTPPRASTAASRRHPSPPSQRRSRSRWPTAATVPAGRSMTTAGAPAGITPSSAARPGGGLRCQRAAPGDPRRGTEQPCGQDGARPDPAPGLGRS